MVRQKLFSIAKQFTIHRLLFGYSTVLILSRLKHYSFRNKVTTFPLHLVILTLHSGPFCQFQYNNTTLVMSFVAHRFLNIHYCFLHAGAVEKIKTNILNSTRPNR